MPDVEDGRRKRRRWGTALLVNLANRRQAFLGYLGLLLTLGAVVRFGGPKVMRAYFTTPSFSDMAIGRERLQRGFAMREACRADSAPRKHAVVTLMNALGMTRYMEYLTSAKVLGKSLMMHGNISCSVDLVVMVPEALAEDANVAELLKFGWSSIRPAPAVHVPNEILERIEDRKFRTMFAKLNLFNWVHYETILYMDSDTLVLSDIMPLFDRYAPEMAREGKAIGWVHDQPYNIYPHGHNAGVMLLRPSPALFKRLVDVSASGKFDIQYAEQGVLNEVFKGPETFLELPQDYNFNVVINKANTTARGHVERVRIIHFTIVKPFDPFTTPWNCFGDFSYVDCKEWFLIDAVNR